MDVPAIDLSSFDDGLRAAVIGASGGIGRAFTEALAGHERVASVHALSRSGEVPTGERITSLPIDLDDEASIERAAGDVRKSAEGLDLVIIAVGILHDGDGLRPEKSWSWLDAATMAKVFRINTIGPALAAKHFLPLLAKDRRALLAALSARVGSIDDNGYGGWHSYRASKAALNMLIRNFSIELARRNKHGFCVGLHPGTVDTGLSEPFQGNVSDGKLFTPAFAASSLLNVIGGLEEGDSGAVFAWNGERIPA